MSFFVAVGGSLEQPAQCRVRAGLRSPSAIFPSRVRHPRSYIDGYAQSDDRQIGVVVQDAALQKLQGSTFIRKKVVNALHLSDQQSFHGSIRNFFPVAGRAQILSTSG